jgi:hypothetical protein
MRLCEKLCGRDLRLGWLIDLQDLADRGPGVKKCCNPMGFDYGALINASFPAASHCAYSLKFFYFLFNGWLEAQQPAVAL